MPHSVPETRARERGALSGSSRAGVLRVAALAALVVPFVCEGDGASLPADAPWVNVARADRGAPPPAPQTLVAALRPEREGQTCTSAADCVDGCTSWFEDADADGFGNPDTAQGFCGSRAPASRVPLVRNDQDCCDLNDRVRPTQTEAFSSRIEESCPLARGYDYDCDGVIRYGDDMGVSVWAGSCDATSAVINEPNTPCVERAGVFLGPGNALGMTPEDLLTAEGDAALCGNPSIEWKSCSLAGSACQGTPSLAPPCN